MRSRFAVVPMVSLAGVAVAALAGPVAAGLTTPEFARPIVLKPASNTFVGTPTAALASSGRVIVAWPQQLAKRSFGIVARRGSVSGRFGAVERITRSGFAPHVASGVDGGGAVIWLARGTGERRRVQVAVAHGRGRFGRSQTLASVVANVTSQQVVATGKRYVAVWWQGIPGTSRHEVRYSIGNGAGRFGRAQTLAADTGPLTGVSVATAPDGAVVAAWGTPLGGTASTNQQLDYARLAPGTTTFGPPTRIRALFADSGAETTGIRVAVGPGGSVLSWIEQGHLPELLRAVRLGRSDAVVPETVHALESDDLGKRYATPPVLALPGNGASPVAAWAVLAGPGGESETVTDSRVFAATRAVDGTYGDAVQLSTPGTISSQPVAVATRATSIVAWSSGSYVRHRLQYAVRVGSGFGAIRSLTGGYAERDLSLVSTNDAAIAVWASRPSRAGSRTTGRGVAVAILKDRS